MAKDIPATAHRKYYPRVTEDCPGPCQKYKAAGVGYREGVKRCQHCELFIEWDGAWCPCCGHRLRSHAIVRRKDAPRN